MNEINPWINIPLTDYELHMQHEDVGQAKLLNYLTKKYLAERSPEYPLFLGVSGGNGLEHIDIERAKRVFAVDINSSYLEQTRERFGSKIKNLNLVTMDIGSSNKSIIEADFVWAALIFEYVDIEKCFEFIANNTSEHSRLIVTIQSNNGAQAVSNTGVESIKFVGSIFKIVKREDLQEKAAEFAFRYIDYEENFLPNGKSLLTFEFLKSAI